MKAKITESHDWVRLALKEDKENSLSLTISRRGESASGRGIEQADLKRALWGFGVVTQQKGTGKTNGQRMAELEALAVEAVSIENFTEKLIEWADKVSPYPCPYTSAKAQAECDLRIAKANVARLGG